MTNKKIIKNKKSIKELSLEKKHNEFLGEEERFLNKNPHNLQQPTPYPIIHTITTYGAYEDPI